MLFLAGSIILTSYLTLSFKVLQRYKVPVFPSIVFNYLTCVFTGSLVNGQWALTRSSLQNEWMPWAFTLGCLFIVLFNIIAFTTQQLGVAVASVANKLSLVIPAIFFIIYQNESLGILKIAGILLAIAAVILTCYTGNQSAPKNISPGLALGLPLILFAGSGALDTIYKFVEETHLNETNLNPFLISSFAAAGGIGLLVLLYRYIRRKEKFDRRTVVAGLLIGIPNYFSIWCLGKVYKQNWMESSAIIPVNNMGIVLFSTVVAWLLFKEKLSRINWLGITLAVISIACISFSGGGI
jgi:drug/metabolite transporter (DMT)-like permease